MSMLDVRSDLSDGDTTTRTVGAKNFDIVANQANGADSGVIPIHTPALESDDN